MKSNDKMRSLADKLEKNFCENGLSEEQKSVISYHAMSMLATGKEMVSGKSINLYSWEKNIEESNSTMARVGAELQMTSEAFKDMLRIAFELAFETLAINNFSDICKKRSPTYN